MMDQAIKFLLDTVFGLVTYAFLLRFAMQWLRAPFRNPVGQAVTALTDWAVKPLRRVLPGFRGHRLVDAAARVARAVRVAARSRCFVGGGGFARDRRRDAGAARGGRAPEGALWLLIVVVFAQAILSWVAPDGPALGTAQRADVPLPAPDPPGHPAARRHARPVAADRDRAAAAGADAAGAVARARGAARVRTVGACRA